MSYYDTGSNGYLLRNCIERLAHEPRKEGSVVLLYLQLYPALLVLYACGICALSAKRFNNLAAILLEPKVRERRSNDKVPIIYKMNVNYVFYLQAGNLVPRPNAKNEYTPASNYLFDVLRPILRNYLPDDMTFEEAFDIFEYILALTYWDLIGDSAPTGRFAWRYKGRFPEKSPIYEFLTDGHEQKDEWGLLKAGFFGYSINRFIEKNTKFNEFQSEISRGWH